MGSEKRVRNCRLTLRFSEDELARATEMAKQCDLGLSTYLREVGLGYEPKSTIDSQAVAQLAHLHGDLGRVGGLLKCGFLIIQNPVMAVALIYQNWSIDSFLYSKK